MPFSIVQNDIARIQADAIVNPANPKPVVGAGTDAAIHAAAGPQLLAAREQIGVIRCGSCAVTPAFGLDARYVIHTVGPVWHGGAFGEARKLRRCYDEALRQAAELDCESVAFPLLSTGTYGFPKEKGLRIALDAFRDFLQIHEMNILLVVWDRESVRLSEQLHSVVEKYVDEHYVAQQTRKEYGLRPSFSARRRRAEAMQEADTDACDTAAPFPDAAPCGAPCASAAPVVSNASALSAEPTLSELLRHTDAGFSETVLKLIDRSGRKDAEVYRRANLSRQHFSKIRSNPDYRPTKPTALALAIALELDLEQTKDLIGRAGYALTNSSKFDVIVSYFISKKHYDLFEINAALFEFDQVTLGAS